MTTIIATELESPTSPLGKYLQPPLSECGRLKILNIRQNYKIKDLSPLFQIHDLEELHIGHLTSIKNISFLDEGFAVLRRLDITRLPVGDLSPLTRLQSLEYLACGDIPRSTPLLPLASVWNSKICIVPVIPRRSRSSRR